MDNVIGGKSKFLSYDLRNSFPNNVHIYYRINSDTEWNFYKDINVHCEYDGHAIINISELSARYIKLVFSVKNVRLEGKYFIQLSEIKININNAKEKNDSYPAIGNIEGNYYDNIVNKKGLFFGSNVSAETWFFSKNQQLPPRVFYESKIMIIVMKGTIEVLCNGESILIKENKWIFIPKGISHIIKNRSNRSCIIEIKDNTPSCSVWGNR